MTYRSDIDGMRCLAVSSVFLFHLNEKLFPGGFTGVDIFFVISGFLITRIIVSEVKNSSFSMTRFYARRVRRIFPALFTILFFTAILAIIGLEPDAYQRFVHEVRYAALQVSNFFFAQERGYFDPASGYSLLLHTWSLGVEEQFYLIWPLLILTTFRFWQHRFLQVLVIITLLSFIYSDYLCKHSSQAAFYLLPSRAWELGTGGIVAVASLPRIQSLKFLNLLASIGLIFVLAPMFMLNSSGLFPGRYAIISVLGIALLLYTGGDNRKTVVFKLLSWKPFIAIGTISYSLYLWHWPLIVFHKITTGNSITLLSGIMIIFLATGCSSLSYFFIERPCRYGTFPKKVTKLFSLIFSEGSRLRTAGLGSLLLIVLPALATSLALYSINNDNNKIATTLTLDVEVVLSKEPLASEAISVLWKDDRGFYVIENSQTLRYSEDYKVSGNRYRFEFPIPGITQLRDIRLDPLKYQGEVNITSILMTGGIFRIPQKISIKELGTGNIVNGHNITMSYSDTGLNLTSSGEDPYLNILSGKQKNTLESLMIFLFMFFISLLILLMAHFVKTDKVQNSVLTAGATAMLITLLMSSRLLYSNHSQWRFLQTEDAGKRFTTIPISKISKIPQSNNPDIVLLGDSHVGNYAATIHDWSQQNGMSLKVLAQPGCPPIFYELPKRNGKNVLSKQYFGCMKRYHGFIDRTLANPKTNIVFIAFREEFYFENPFIFFNSYGEDLLSGTRTYKDIVNSAFTETIQTLLDGGKKIILLGQVPVLRESPKICLTRDVTLYSSPFSKKPDCDINLAFSDMKLKSAKELFSQFSSISNDIYYFEPGKYIRTIFGNNKDVLYFDDNHLNKIGVKYLAPFLKDELSHFLQTYQAAEIISLNSPSS